MIKRSKKIFWMLGIVSVLSGVILLYWFGIEFIEQSFYDVHHSNPYVAEANEIKKILNTFETVSFKNLPVAFKKKTKMDLKKYQNMVQHQYFYVLHKKDVYRRIVGNFRIKDFFSRDAQYYNTYYFSSDTLYWGIDKRILYKLLELQNLLSSKGYDRDALYVGYGHRSPKLNEWLHAAALSRHIAGEAIDLTIGDIDKNGTYTDKDKQTVINLCETYIIGNRGGIGLYPGSKVVHIDIRGYRARWNSY